MDEQLAWRYLTGSDADQAERALAVIQKRYLPYLHGYLKHAGVDNADMRDDVISNCFFKLWKYRERHDCPNVKAGRGLLCKMVHRCLIDNFRKHARTVAVPIETIENDEGHAANPSESQVHARILARQLIAAADCLWLGLDPSLPQDTHTRQMLAAQCFYLDGWTLDDVYQMLKGDSPPIGEPDLDIVLLKEWLRHPGVLRLLAYNHLCYDSTKLLASVLGLQKVSAKFIGELWNRACASPPDAMAFAELSWAVVALAILRYYQSVSIDEVATARNEVVHRWGYTHEHILKLLDLMRRRLPFCRETELLIRTLELQVQLPPSQILGTADLWERLAFQYSYMLDLAQKDILERVQPSAKLAGYVLSDSTLNSWISGRRLQTHLLAYWKKMYGDPDYA